MAELKESAIKISADFLTSIGCGYWGPNLIRNFVEIPDAELVAIADLDQERLDVIKGRFPQIPVATQDFTELFDLELDAVVIATPPQTHFAIAKIGLYKMRCKRPFSVPWNGVILF